MRLEEVFLFFIVSSLRGIRNVNHVRSQVGRAV
jgi:hypothetical protein